MVKKYTLMLIVCMGISAQYSSGAITKTGKQKAAPVVLVSLADAELLIQTFRHLESLRQQITRLTRTAVRRSAALMHELQQTQQIMNDLKQRMPADQYNAVMQELTSPLPATSLPSKL